jgi:hypothetical protein
VSDLHATDILCKPDASNGNTIAAQSSAPAFKLSPHLAKQYREFTDSIWAAPPSEKLDAFTMSARYVFGMSSQEFPLPEKADRLLMAAHVNGLIEKYGNDEIQARLEAACADPIVIDENTPRLDPAESHEIDAAEVSAPLIKSGKQFVADFVPPDYLVDGLLQEGFFRSRQHRSLFCRRRVQNLSDGRQTEERSRDCQAGNLAWSLSIPARSSTKAMMKTTERSKADMPRCCVT